MKKYIVAGNWKMNGSEESITELLNGFKNEAGKVSDVEWIVFPPSPYFALVKNILENTVVKWGAQNVSDQLSGAHTGEISVTMLQDFGCSYVILGHSERRHIYGETNAQIAAKLITVLDAGLTPVLCVGETLDERNSGSTMKVVAEQLDAVLDLEGGIDLFKKTIVAYEPVWAIGTGVTATPEQAQEVHAEIRNLIAKHDNNVAEQLRILYGGSVKPNNAEALFAMSDINGGLIGGASLKAQDFLEIGKSCK